MLLFTTCSPFCNPATDGKSGTAAHMRKLLLPAMWSNNVAYTVVPAVRWARRQLQLPWLVRKEQSAMMIIDLSLCCDAIAARIFLKANCYVLSLIITLAFDTMLQ